MPFFGVLTAIENVTGCDFQSDHFSRHSVTHHPPGFMITDKPAHGQPYQSGADITKCLCPLENRRDRIFPISLTGSRLSSFAFVLLLMALPISAWGMIGFACGCKLSGVMCQSRQLSVLIVEYTSSCMTRKIGLPN